jgi:hypothetical protein
MVTAGGPMWLPPPMHPVWGPYFSASDDEVGKAVDAAQKAKDAKLVSDKTAVTYTSNHFGVEDVEEEREAIEHDAQAAETAHSEGFHAAMARLGAAEQDPTDDDELAAKGDTDSTLPPPDGDALVVDSPNAPGVPALVPAPAAAQKPIPLTPTDIASIVLVNQALASLGLPPRGDADGDLTVAQFQAKHATVVAAAANAAAGDAGGA